MRQLWSRLARSLVVALGATGALGAAGTTVAVPVEGVAVGGVAAAVAGEVARTAKEPANSTQRAGFTLESMTTVLSKDAEYFDLNLSLHNPSAAVLRGAVALSVGTGTANSRETLNGWMTAASSQGYRLTRVATLENVAVRAKSTQNLNFHIPVTELPLANPQMWGPRFLEAAFETQTPDLDTTTAKTSTPTSREETKAEATTEVAPLHTFLVWDSGAAFQPSSLLVLAPVTATAADQLSRLRQEPVGSEADFTGGSAQRVRALCQAAARLPLTLAWDPFLLDDSLWGREELVELLGKGKTTSGEKQITWLEALQRHSCGTQEYAYLPPGDFSSQDLAALNPAELQRLHQATSEVAQATAALLPDFSQKLLLWPSTKASSTTTKARTSTTGNTVKPGTSALNYLAEVQTWGLQPRLVLEDPESYESSFAPSTYDIDARREIVTGSDSVSLGWAADPQISALLAGVSPVQVSDDEDGARGGASGTGASGAYGDDGAGQDFSALQLRQWALAQSAVLTRQRPFSSRLFVAALPRDYAADSAQSQILEALSQARWLNFPSLSQARPDNRTTSTVLGPTTSNRYGAAAQELNQTLQGAQALALTVPEPPKLQRSFAALALARNCTTCLGLSRTQRDQLPNPAQAVLSLVSAEPASTINLLDSQAKIPISVSNQLNQPISVRLVLEPGDLRLQIEDSPVLQIPARSISPARIAVRAVGSGNLTVRVSLQNLEGQPLGEVHQIKVRVRAEWESTGTWIISGLLAAVFVFGLVRRIRRGRPARTAADREVGSSPVDSALESDPAGSKEATRGGDD